MKSLRVKPNETEKGEPPRSFFSTTLFPTQAGSTVTHHDVSRRTRTGSAACNSSNA
jgi:hypothetical protein